MKYIYYVLGALLLATVICSLFFSNGGSGAVPTMTDQGLFMVQGATTTDTEKNGCQLIMQNLVTQEYAHTENVWVAEDGKSICDPDQEGGSIRPLAKKKVRELSVEKMQLEATRENLKKKDLGGVRAVEDQINRLEKTLTAWKKLTGDK